MKALKGLFVVLMITLFPSMGYSLVAQGCYSDSDCPEGQACYLLDCHCEDPDVCDCPLMGYCSYVSTEPPVCYDDSDCGPGMFCALVPCVCEDGSGMCNCGYPYGYCEEFQDECKDMDRCLSDVDCGEGLSCVFPACDCDWDDPDCYCDRCGGFCEPSIYPEGCLSDSDCPTGFSCLLPDCWCGSDDWDCDCLGGGICVEDSNPWGCFDDSECGVNEVCVILPCDCEYYDEAGDAMPCACPVNGYCEEVAPKCVVDEDCPAGQVCLLMDLCSCGPDDDCLCEAMGYCVEDTNPVGCLADSDCAAGQVCIFAPCDCMGGYDAADPAPCACPDMGYCEEARERCFDDSQCRDGYFCEIPEAFACGDEQKDSLCLPEGECRPIENNGTCRTDADCGSNQFCALTDCFCPPDALCDCENVGLCQDRETIQGCKLDSDCGANQVCVLTQVPCPEDANCISMVVGECRDGDQNICYSDADCRDGYHCERADAAGMNGELPLAPGICRVDEVPRTVCFSDDDCDQNQQCALFPCVCPNGQDCYCPEDGICIDKIVVDCPEIEPEEENGEVIPVAADDSTGLGCTMGTGAGNPAGLFLALGLALAGLLVARRRVRVTNL